MEIEQFLNKLPDAYSRTDREMLEKAYRFAEKAHQGQTRANGQPYFSHPLGVANILIDMDAIAEITVAALLHDVMVDCGVTGKQLRAEFGETIARYVEDVTRITSLPYIFRADQHPDERKPLSETTGSASKINEDLAETLRKMLLAIGDDVRVVVIKLACRLHNMRTLNALPQDRQKRIAQETLDIFAPLANRLGIWQMKWELEDLGFRYTNPDKYKEIAENLTLRRTKRMEEVDKIIETLLDLLQKSEIKAKITGRPKHIYSIYRKMLNKEKSFDGIRDLRAVRIIVDDVETCYKVLGIIHTHYSPIPGEFDDYIAAKKANDYQSLHTAVIYSDGKPLEVQIRTYEMHQNAEYGIAAHWRYKENKQHLSGKYEQKVSAMRSLLAWSMEVDDNQELLEGMRTDIFKDRVYVVTPKGDVVDLPQGSTPIDFAYQVHTDIGHRTRGAKINGRLVPLNYNLQTGDQVEILTVNRGGPSRDWLNPNLGLVKSSRSRSKIRLWFKQQDRGQNLEHGKILVEKELKRLGIEDFDLRLVLAAFNAKTIEDLYVGIGTGDIPIGKLVNRIGEFQADALKSEELVLEEPGKVKTDDSITVMGLNRMDHTFARCCNPMPGDPIIGYVTRGRGVTIHRMDCPNALRIKDTERLIKVDWGIAQQTYPVPLQITAYDRQGLVSDISTVLSSEPVRLIDLSMTTRQHVVKINLVLEVPGINQLSRVLARLENLPNVIEATRVRPG
ncbi:MAG: bifunctional (p)ppGpp synthetase/guanosine-3',5'-bis(diphosphate) 3'-pyrophosphohydrolase [Anaerolineaceae bacterium]|jgi:GTP pyrophosphokinase|nr:bifunctional (p)ppGpp synthetase/guanosine-3',5'-bis(diphosphate) 3'-pyrophosphohydrolase [Anaerolineaceae bacterium]MDD4041987.1 bifunctional (p)ppGpp synthetase/guanosine-3',5'-bis(diphosphate) 3'-pyrophosphohydrolase [Anaerolineaceae bacterium]MDD4577452.1 bifunctional (p)ppGpp synthetase/guanosine-3',5'-bis(diphosphate) 3'-pyrophosphohydrolase [Anaerolineaceae bacterium]